MVKRAVDGLLSDSDIVQWIIRRGKFEKGITSKLQKNANESTNGLNKNQRGVY